VTLTVAFIGFGEVGQLFGKQLAAQQGVAVRAHDVLFDDAAKGPGMKAIAAETGVAVCGSHVEACRDASLVISAVTADRAVDVAHQCANALTPEQIYVDLNSISPTTKGQVADALQRDASGFVEFAVMAPVAGPGIAVPILAGGAKAKIVAEMLNPLGMKIDAVAEKIGVASATKLCRSIVIKGMEAIMVDLKAATEATGVWPAVLASLSASYPGMDWAKIIDYMPPRVKRHGIRRAAEMREAGKMLDEAGANGDFARAIADAHERYARANEKQG